MTTSLGNCGKVEAEYRAAESEEDNGADRSCWITLGNGMRVDRPPHKHCKELLGKSLIFATKYIEVCD